MTVLCIASTTTAIAGGTTQAVRTTRTPVNVDVARLLQVGEYSAISDPGRADTTLVVAVPVAGLDRAQFAQAILDHGWMTTPTEGGWFTCVRGTGPEKITLHIGVLPWLGDDPFMIGTPEGLAKALNDWQRRTGASYRYTPGVSALASMRSVVGFHRGLRWRLALDPVGLEWWQPPARFHDIHYRAKGTIAGETYRWDMRSAYLAAAAAVELPHGRLQPTGTDPYGPGYLRCRITRMESEYLGAPDRQGCLWMTHVMYRYLSTERGRSLEVVDSYTAGRDGESSRVLRGWAEKWRNYALDPGIPLTTRKALKLGYAQAIGLMDVAKGNVYRPDWRQMIIDQTRVSMLRRIHRVHLATGKLPVMIDVDSVWYNCPPETINTHIGCGPLMGNMRYEGAHPLPGKGKK